MARRTDWLFGFMVLASIGLETYALAAIVASSFGPVRVLLHGSTAAAAIVRGLNITALNAIAMTLVILLVHVVTAARRERDRANTNLWLGKLAEQLLTPGVVATRTKPTHAALEALLDLQDTLAGDAGEAVTMLLRRSGLVRVEAGRRRMRTRFGLLELLETLARARLPEYLPLVQRYFGHRDATVRFAAARAAARIADADSSPELAERLAPLALGARAWLEVLLLFRAPEAPVRKLLATGDASARWAAVEVVGRRHLLSLAEDLCALLSEQDDELRAAALRALARLRFLPTGHEDLVFAALLDDADFVRLQAVRVLELMSDARIGLALWERLGDPSFYVRQAAARALEKVDNALLLQASQAHPDRYGRAMARQQLPIAHAA